MDRQYITLALLLDLSCIPIASLPCNYSSIPPPVICLTYARNRENFPGWVPPSSVSCSTALGHTRHCLSPCYALCYIVCFVFTVPSPLFYPLDFETNATAAAPIDYGVDDPSFSAELPGKPPPLVHPNIAYSFPLLLALE